MSEPQQLPMDLVSMAADGRLKTSDTYLELIEDKLAIEQDIISMEAQLLMSDRTEEWRNSCLYNLSCARSELRSIKNALAQIEELCRIVANLLSLPGKEKARQEHNERMREIAARKSESVAKSHTEKIDSQERIALKVQEEKTKRYELSLNKDLKAAQVFKGLVKPILGEEKYKELCTQAKESVEKNQSTE